MNFWILACSALAVVAAHTVFTFTRQRRRRGNVIADTVSSEWLASAKIHHEDQN